MITTPIKYDIKTAWFTEKKTVSYLCPKCQEQLKNKLQDAGQEDRCPICHHKFVVPGQKELAAQLQLEKRRREIAQEKIRKERENVKKMVKRQEDFERKQAEQKEQKRLEKKEQKSSETEAVRQLKAIRFMIWCVIAAFVLYLLSQHASRLAESWGG